MSQGLILTGRMDYSEIFARDCNQRWNQHLWAKTSSYIFLEMSISGKCNALNNCSSVTKTQETQPKDPSEKCLLASAG